MSSGEGLEVTHPRHKAETVAARIEEMIAASHLPPGHRLGSKDDLRLQARVAVATMNETIRLLQARGVVEARPGPGGGVFVAQQTPLVRLGNKFLALQGGTLAVADAILVRDTLDVPLSEDAARYCSSADAQELRLLMKSLQAAGEDLAGSSQRTGSCTGGSPRSRGIACCRPSI